MRHEQARSTLEALREGIEHFRAGRLADAEAVCQHVLQDRPGDPDALHLLGLVAYLRGKHEYSIELITQALRRAPSSPYFLNSLGQAYRALLKPREALACFDNALTIMPDFVDALTNRSVTLQALKRYQEAIASCDRALAIKPDHTEAIFNRAVALQELGRLEDALDSYNRVLEAAPEYLAAFNNRGNILRRRRCYREALASYDAALRIRPDFPEILNNRALVLQDLHRYEEALASCDKAIAVRPGYADPLLNRGNILRELARYEDALASYDKALASRPDFAEALLTRGLVLQELRRHEQAIVNFDMALAISPSDVDALNNRGNALQELMRHDEALESYDKALAIKPDFAEALNNRGYALSALKRYEEAVASYARARVLAPSSEFVHGMFLHTKMQVCDWSDFEKELGALLRDVSCGGRASPPLPILALSESAVVQRKAAETWVQARFPLKAQAPSIERRRRKKIRLAYFSNDFRLHPVSILSAEMFETHDRSRFDVTAFSTGPDTKDEMRRRLENAFDRFIDVRHLTDQGAAEQARALDIDIAVDLGGHTKDSRFGVFASRAAPIQASYLGYLGTTGAPFIDYLIADHTVVPEGCRQHYSERIAYLPSYQANDRTRKISKKLFTRQELGLPSTGFVYCCFNNSYKIVPGTFDGWMRILQAVSGSVLWLYADNGSAVRNLRKHAQTRGVDPERLVFAKHMPQPEHLARYRAADLFLDTLPCNAGATASDALWVGVPVLTRIGEAFSSRVAASLLHAIELPELVTGTQEQYENLAIHLAKDPKRLGAIKLKLKRNRLTKLLFDTKLFTEHIEDAYSQMYEQWQRGLPAEDIFVPRRRNRPIS